MTIRIVLADDHRLFREALRSTLASEADFDVVAEASSGEGTLTAVALHQPDVLLLDIGLPDMNGIEAARKISQKHPLIKIIAVTGYADRMFIKEMFKSGACGYVVKSAGAGELVSAIRTVAEGREYLSPEAAHSLLLRTKPGAPSPVPPLSVLSKRERMVLELLAKGQKSSQIGLDLGISAATVDVYRRNIKRKLRIHSTAELTRYAIREGLVSI